jgi:hypothetical protein
MAPLSAISISAGLLFILRPIGQAEQEEENRFSSEGLRSFLKEILPILIIIGFIVFHGVLTKVLSSLGIQLVLPAAFSIFPGIIAALLWVAMSNHLPWGRMKSSFFDRSAVSILVLVLAIMVFQGALKESQASAQIRSELLAYRIPVSLVIMILPFLSGFITGIAVGFVGTSFPLIIPMFPENDPVGYLAAAGLSFVYGFMGMMLSPVHLCFLVTKDYYQASLFKSYRYLLLPVLSVMGTATGLFFLVQALF